MNKVIVIVCKDLNLAVLSYYNKFFLEIDIIVVSPKERNLPLYKNVIYKKDEDFLRREDFSIIEDTHRPNWYYQQFLKYSIVINLKYDLVHIVDGDSFVRKDLMFSNLISYSKKSIEKQYSNFIELQTKENVYSDRNYITNQMCFNKVLLKKIIIDLSKEGNHWIITICKTLNFKDNIWFSEYQFYANYLLKRGLVEEQEIKVFRRFDIIHKKVQLGFNNYSVLAYENQHKTGVIRKIRAKLFYFLNLNLG
jgi:hypothetical protein